MQVKGSLETIQASQAERIRGDLAAFGGRVAAARASLKARPYLAWSTGAAAAYPALDAAAAELAKLRKECDRFAELARMFDLAGDTAWGLWCMLCLQVQHCASLDLLQVTPLILNSLHPAPLPDAVNPISAQLAEARDSLVAVKDVWDCAQVGRPMVGWGGWLTAWCCCSCAQHGAGR